MFISPMLAQKADQPFDDERIIAEPKMDGFRLILTMMDGVKAYTRHENEVSARFPELKRISIPTGTVLDGELIVTDNQGRPDFERVMKRLQARNPVKIERLARELPVQYVVFDILYHRGKPIIDRPLMERKVLLDEVVKEDHVFARIRFVEENATGLFQVTGDAGLEGIVIKQKDAPYQPGKRSWSWQKVIHWKKAEVVITGYRKDEPGWLIAVEEDGRLKPGGIMELGIGPTERKAFYPVARSIKTHEDWRFVYLEPRIRCRVKYKKRTHAGFLREPVFQEFVL
jgi:DNA ligase 1